MVGHGATWPGGMDWARAREGHDQGLAVVEWWIIFTNSINLVFSYHPLKCFRGSGANRAIGVWLGKVRLELFFADLDLTKLFQTVPRY
jgi:hypothetical protein